MGNRFRHFALGPILWRSVDHAEKTPPEIRSSWQHGVAWTAALVDNNRGAYGPLLAVVFALVSLFVGPGPWYARVFLAAVIGLVVSWLVPSVVAGLAALHAPYVQRDAARAAIPLAEAKYQGELDAATRAHASAMKAVDESHERREKASAKQLAARQEEANRYLRLLGEAEARVTELEEKIDAQRGNTQAFLREHARIQGQFGSNIIKQPPERLAARRIRTELKDALRKATTYSDAAARLPEGQGLHYEKGFRFDTDAWKEYAADLHALPAYDSVEAAYTEIGRANDVIGWRETGAKGLHGVSKEEDLPAVISATGSAVKALDDVVLESGVLRTPYEHFAEKLRDGFALSSREPSEKLDEDVTQWTRSVVNLLKRNAPERVAEFGTEEPDFATFDPTNAGFYWRGPNAHAFLRKKLRALEQIRKDVRH